MARAIVALIAVAAAVAGCAIQPIHRWSRPGATYRDYLQDRYACVKDARATAGSGYLLSNGVGAESSGPVISSSVFMPCMAAKGWSLDPNGFQPPPGGVVPLQ